MTRTAYPSDLSDSEWRILEPLIPAAKLGGRPCSLRHLFIDGGYKRNFPRMGHAYLGLDYRRATRLCWYPRLLGLEGQDLTPEQLAMLSHRSFRRLTQKMGR